MNRVELRVERLRKEFTQKDIAKAIGMTEASYCRKENGIRVFTGEEIKKLAMVLDLDMARVNEIFFENKLTVCDIKQRN